LILQTQKPDGYWTECAYEKDEENVEYYGAIPTSFCILALVEAYKALGKQELLNAAIRGSDYLYSQESSGYFVKQSINKTDVLNTNLICGLALLETSKVMNPKSKRREIYKAACARAIRRSLNSQHMNGAYPYTSYGLVVPFLYHSMTLALLLRLATEFQDSLLEYSLRKGISFLQGYTKLDGSIDWKKENFQDKSGACWAYAWSYNCFESLGMADLKKRTHNHLESIKGKKYFFESDFNKQEDPFYTAWCLLAFSLSRKKEPKPGIGGAFRFWLNQLCNLPPKLVFPCRILQRKMFSYGLDKGPVEYW